MQDDEGGAGLVAEGKWWPSEWGADDQRGALNRLTFRHVLAATQVINKGRLYELGRVYVQKMPTYGDRQYRLTLVRSPSNGSRGTNRLVYYEETISGEIGQIGTQLDGLGHIGTRVQSEDVFYNGYKASDVVTPNGLKKLGIENVGAIFTRGILLDVASLKGVDRLEPGYLITVDDIEQFLRRAELEIREGDVVLFRTGHGKLWMADGDVYHSGEPGPGISALKWLIARSVVIIGADNWGVEVVPGENSGSFFEGHQWTINRGGVHLLENLNLEKLAEDNVYEFAFLFAPVPFKGAAGSPGNPIAIC